VLRTRILSSPLTTLLLGCGVLSSFTCAYGHAAGDSPHPVADVHTSGASTPAIESSAHVAERAVVSPAVEPPPAVVAAEREGRLLHMPDLEQHPFGLPIRIEDADGHSMDHLHAALARAARGEGQARLLFWGASHTASDLYTGYLRRALQARFGDAGHGFVLPVQPWRSYRQDGVRVESNRTRWEPHRIRAHSRDEDRFGVAGVYIETDRAGAFGRVSTADHGDIGQHVGIFDLYYLEQPEGGSFDVYIDGRRQRRIRTRADSARDAYATFHVEDGAHSFEVRANGTGKVRIFGVAMERERPGVVVDTLGINGARARSQLLWNDETYRDQLARRRPDLVVLAYGTNESGDDSPIERYEQKLRQVLTRVREVVPEASCLLIGPSDRPLKIEDGVFEDRPRTAQVVEVQRRVAIELGCGFYDLVAFQGGPLSMLEWSAADPPYGAPDHIHYTRRGYQRLGQTLLEALMDGYSGPASSAPAAPDSAPASPAPASAGASASAAPASPAPASPAPASPGAG